MIQKPQDNREVLLIDMDNTLNKFWINFNTIYNKIFTPSIDVKKEGLKDYHILVNYVNASEESLVARRQAIFETEGFWLDQDVYEDAIDVLKLLNDKYNLYIITSPWTSALNCYTEKVLWLMKHFPFIPLEKLIFTRDKWLVKCDYIIDDAPFYLERNDCKTIAMDYEYNRHILVNYRADNWKDIGRYLGV